MARATFSAYTCVSMCGAWQVAGSSERSNNRLSKCLKLWISCGSSKPGLPISSKGEALFGCWQSLKMHAKTPSCIIRCLLLAKVRGSIMTGGPEAQSSSNAEDRTAV